MAPKRQSLCRTAAQHIRAGIINGVYQPGERIIESDIAQQLDISRGPIREALKTLAQEGMVRYEENKGCTVVFLSPQEAWEVFFMRGHLEKLALEVCGGKIPPQHLLAMRTALDKMRAAQGKGAVEDIVQQDSLFHGEILRASGIARLYHLWNSLSPLNLSMFSTGVRAGAFDFSDQWDKHDALFRVLEKGELAPACDAVLHHYLRSGERIFRNTAQAQGAG